MGIIKNLILIFLALIITISSSNSQPKMSIFIFGGYSTPLGDFKQDVPEFNYIRANWPYQTSAAYNLGAIGILPIEKKRKLNLSFGITYTAFSHNITVYDSTTPSGGGIDNLSTGFSQVTFSPKINLFTLNFGIAYVFNPEKAFHPWVLLDATGNFFSGQFNFDKTTNGYSSSDLKSEIRLGLQFGGGLEYKINNDIGVFASIKYNLANLIGKSAENSESTSSVALGDKSHTEFGTSFGNRSISYLQMSVGIVLYLHDNREKK